MKKVTKKVKPNDSSTLGKRIEYIRTNKGMTQDKLAGEIGRNRVEVNYYENDNRSPDYSTLKAICEALSVSADYLLGLTNFESLETNNKVINESLGLTDKAISNLNSFYNTEKEVNSFGILCNKVYLLNRMLESKDFIYDITTALSDCYRHLSSRLMVKNTDPYVFGIKKNDVDKEFKFAMFNAQNVTVKLFNEMNDEFIVKSNFQVEEKKDDFYV